MLYKLILFYKKRKFLFQFNRLKAFKPFKPTLSIFYCLLLLSILFKSCFTPKTAAKQKKISSVFNTNYLGSRIFTKILYTNTCSSFFSSVIVDVKKIEKEYLVIFLYFFIFFYCILPKTYIIR